jgi:hypothetical protein
VIEKAPHITTALPVVIELKSGDLLYGDARDVSIRLSQEIIGYMRCE